MRRTHAFTLVEVMMAVTVMTVGALGLMALQQTATRGNSEARNLSMATQLTRTWVERLRRDSVHWWAQGQPIQSRYLVLAPPPGMPQGPWVSPEPQVRPDGTVEATTFDHFGRDQPPGGDVPPVFFTNVRFGWMDGGDTLRVDVRTVYHRHRPTQRHPFQPGGEAGISAALAQAVDLRAVYASTIIRRRDGL
jgi:prepilin-type N-terminal cleavage/methylation domain-containing protein